MLIRSDAVREKRAMNKQAEGLVQQKGQSLSMN